jgi:Holliday junction resolvase
MVNSRNKGASGEREFARVCRDEGYDNARRGQQFSGIEGKDVVGLLGIHIECKRTERLNIHDAIAQSIRDAKSGDIPIVAHRKNRTKWLITMKAEDWFVMFREWSSDNYLKERSGVENGGSSTS